MQPWKRFHPYFVHCLTLLHYATVHYATHCQVVAVLTKQKFVGLHIKGRGRWNANYWKWISCFRNGKRIRVAGSTPAVHEGPSPVLKSSNFSNLPPSVNFSHLPWIFPSYFLQPSHSQLFSCLYHFIIRRRDAPFWGYLRITSQIFFFAREISECPD